MSIDIQNKKLELIQWLSTLNDESVIEKLLELRNAEKEDWWDKISMDEKKSIEKGIEDSKAGRLKSHSEAKKLYGKWL